MSVYFSENGDLWDGRTGEVIPAEPRTPTERDTRVMLLVQQVGGQLANIAAAWVSTEDLATAPGPEALRAIANSTHHLATELQACAENIDRDPPDKRHLPTSDEEGS